MSFIAGTVEELEMEDMRGAKLSNPNLVATAIQYVYLLGSDLIKMSQLMASKRPGRTHVGILLSDSVVFTT